MRRAHTLGVTVTCPVGSNTSCNGTTRSSRTLQLNALTEPSAPVYHQRQLCSSTEGFSRAAPQSSLPRDHFHGISPCCASTDLADIEPTHPATKPRDMTQRPPSGTNSLPSTRSRKVFAPQPEPSMRSMSMSFNALSAILPANVMAASVAATPMPSTTGLLSAPCTAISAPN